MSSCHPPHRTGPQVVLAEKQQCPFTNQPLQFEQLKVRGERTTCVAACYRGRQPCLSGPHVAATAALKLACPTALFLFSPPPPQVLTKTNIHLWRDKIVNGPRQAPA